jgi:hypothetical protein
MNAIAVTPKQHRTELERHVSAPEVVIVQYATGCSAAQSDICSALATEARSYNLNTDPYVVELQGRDDPVSSEMFR